MNDVIVGSGNFKYKINENWEKLPDGFNWKETLITQHNIRVAFLLIVPQTLLLILKPMKYTCLMDMGIQKFTSIARMENCYFLGENPGQTPVNLISCIISRLTKRAMSMLQIEKITDYKYLTKMVTIRLNGIIYIGHVPFI